PPRIREKCPRAAYPVPAIGLLRPVASHACETVPVVVRDLARFGPTTPTRAPGLPPALWRLDRLPGCRASLAAEQPSPSTCERIPISGVRRAARYSEPGAASTSGGI